MLVSACLIGKKCRYDGKGSACQKTMTAVEKHVNAGGKVVYVCPEELGGLGTPRLPAELRGGNGCDALDNLCAVVVKETGTDVTQEFVDGANAALAQHPKAKAAILKARSPSCGSGVTNIDGIVKSGDGVFAALLRRQGINVSSNENL